MPAFNESLLEPAFDESLLVPETRPERGQRLRTELVAARQEPAALSDPNAPPPSPISTFQGASEVALMPPGEQYRQFQLPRFGPTPGVPQPVTTFQGPSEVTLAPESVARRTGEILQSAAASGVEGIVNPMTPPLILGAMAAPEVAIPLLTATMAKSGATELGEGLVDLQQGREAEGIAKVGGGGTALMFAAAPALHPSAFTPRPPITPEFLPRARAALAEEPTPTTEPAPPGEPGAPQPTPATEVPSALQQEAETPVRDVLKPGGTSQGAGEVPANVPSEEVGSRGGAVPGDAGSAQAQAQPEVPLTTAEAPKPAPLTPAEQAAAPSPVIEQTVRRLRAERTGETLLAQAESAGQSPKDIVSGFFRDTYDSLPAEQRAFIERQINGLTGFKPGDEVIKGKPVRNWQELANELDLPEDVSGLQGGERGLIASMLDARAGEAPAAQPVEAPAPAEPTPAPEAPKPAPTVTLKVGDRYELRSEDHTGPVTITKTGQKVFRGLPTDTVTVKTEQGNTLTMWVSDFKRLSEPVAKTKPAPAPVAKPAPTTDVEKKVAFTTSSHRQIERLDRSGLATRGGLPITLGSKTRVWEVPDTPENRAAIQRLGLTVHQRMTKEANARAEYIASLREPEPPAPPAGAAPGPALTLLGLTEDKFALPSLRKLSRDTLRRLANSLGTEATVPAIARRAAERFDEMRQQPPGPVGMGGALAAEMSGTDAPLAGTPAHAVETGPPSERPLGLTDPTSAPFVSLSLEMLGQRSSVPPEFSVQTGLNALAGSSAPRLTAMNRPAGEALVRYASSKIAAPYKALVFSSRVLEKGVNAVKFGAALTEDNLRSVEQNFLRQANEAFEAGDQPAADAAYEKALNVRSTIGGKNSPFRTEEDYQNFLADPATQEAIKRHVQLWQEDIEPQYKMAQSLDPDVELPTRGQQTGARINLKVVLEGDEPGTRPVTASRGGLTASFKRKSPFAREAKGTGDVYESNYPDIIANTYRRQLEIANQNEMNRILVANDLARIDKPGAQVMFGDKPGVPFPLTRRLILTGGEAIPAGQNIYVRPEFAREYRTALNTDAPQRIPFFTEASGLFTRASIAGLGELTTHISNLAIGLFTRPNSPLLLDSIAKATGSANAPIAIVRVLIKAAADNREQVAQLAEIGVVREPPGRPAKSQYPLINAVNMVRGAPRRLIHWADTTIRLTLDDAYKGLVKEGIGENTETERREFINQVGQYNKRLQGQFTVLLRDTGIGPFVTAGKTFNVMGIRNMLLSPGLKATSPMAAAALRANALAGWVGFVTLAATLNWVLTRNKGGGVMGRPGVPTGNIDTGTDDEQGRPISLPLADALGYGRGLRITGARRLIEAKRYGIDQNQALDSALGDVVNAAVGPALGPIVRTGFAAVTGRPPALNVGRTAPVVGPEQSQFAANVSDALRRANPLVNAAYDVREGKSGLEVARSQAQRFSPQPGMTESKAEAMPRIIERARLNEYIDDLARRARRLPLAERAAFIRDEMEKAELSGAERVRVHRQIQGRIRYP